MGSVEDESNIADYGGSVTRAHTSGPLGASVTQTLYAHPNCKPHLRHLAKTQHLGFSVFNHMTGSGKAVP